jgi:DNA-binding NtrC family response regulator
MVAAGQFREDLYYRLKGIEIELPPLRAREHDILAIAASILARVATERDARPKTLAPSGAEALLRHPWPGNIRELENVLRSVTLFADGDEIDGRALAEYLVDRGAPLPAIRTAIASASSSANAPADASDLSDLYPRALASKIPLRELKRRIELECITRALADENGNITRAAERLGMKRPRLSQLLKEHGIDVSAASTKRERT